MPCLGIVASGTGSALSPGVSIQVRLSCITRLAARFRKDSALGILTIDAVDAHGAVVAIIILHAYGTRLKTNVRV
jgi:hypothetical protein